MRVGRVVGRTCGEKGGMEECLNLVMKRMHGKDEEQWLLSWFLEVMFASVFETKVHTIQGLGLFSHELDYTTLMHSIYFCALRTDSGHSSWEKSSSQKNVSLHSSLLSTSPAQQRIPSFFTAFFTLQATQTTLKLSREGIFRPNKVKSL